MKIFHRPCSVAASCRPRPWLHWRGCLLPPRIPSRPFSGLKTETFPSVLHMVQVFYDISFHFQFFELIFGFQKELFQEGTNEKREKETDELCSGFRSAWCLFCHQVCYVAPSGSAYRDSTIILKARPRLGSGPHNFLARFFLFIFDSLCPRPPQNSTAQFPPAPKWSGRRNFRRATLSENRLTHCQRLLTAVQLAPTY